MVKLALKLSALRLWRGKFAFCCQLFSLAAVMAPLLIILGLKHGILSSMRENLLSNPSALEFWFINEELTQEDIETIGKLPETAFILPRLHSLYAQVSLVPEGQPAGREIYRLEATAPGDPVLVKAGIPAPASGQLVLTASMAQKAGVHSGSKVMLVTSRNNKREQLTRTCMVTHVLPANLDRKDGIYAPLPLCKEVEVFVKEGSGSPGKPAPLLHECYAGLVLTEGEPAQRQEICSLLTRHDANRSGLAVVNDAHAFHSSLPEGLPMLWKEGCGLTAVDAKALQSLALEHNVIAVPWNPPCEVTLRGEKGEMTVLLNSRLELPHGDYGLCPAPEQEWIDSRNGPVVELPVQLRQALGGQEAEIIISTPHGESRITCQLCSNDNLSGRDAFTNPQFAAVCHRASQIPARWNYHTGELHYPIVTHFSSMRLYAKDLESVVSLYDKLRERGLKPSADLKIINELLSLEHALNTLYLLISAGAALGAIFSVALSLFNAVENNRRHYAQLLVMGMKHLPLAAIPLFEGIVTTVAAFCCSLGIFCSVSNATEHLFASALSAGSSLCALEPRHVMLFLASSLGVSALAACIAVIRVLRISPSESLREI